MFASRHGQAFLADLIGRVVAAAPPAGGDALALAREAGRRELALQILQWAETGLAGAPRPAAPAAVPLVKRLFPTLFPHHPETDHG